MVHRPEERWSSRDEAYEGSGHGVMSGAAGTMRAAVLAGPGRARIDEVVRPVPCPGRCACGCRAAGACASNLTPWAGPDWMTFPTEPGALGHEAWGGTVDALCDGVEGLRIGERVAALGQGLCRIRRRRGRGRGAPPCCARREPFPGEPLAAP